MNRKTSIGQFARMAALLAFVLSFTLQVAARDVFVMLSGGDSELDNNYSQFLQARAMTAFFQRSYPSNSVWVFFGAGNAEGAKLVFSDVYRVVKRDGVLMDTWLPGTLPRNRPATREEFLTALRREILPAIAGGGTLYLFVGDHGSRTRGADPESVITLWGRYRDEEADNGWGHSEKESLGVSELRRVLAAGIGRGRVVFCMTQCHSGGFHYLAMAHDMTPDRAWFTVQPSWTKHVPPAINLSIAGFSATDELSLASGCDPSPDPDEWAGYERYLPESLLGLNLFTLQRTGNGMKSFVEAHLAASLVDSTIDKPYSTSEQYMERWATLIETHLVRESDLTAPVKRAVAEYQRTVNGAIPKVTDAAFRERQAQFHSLTERLARQIDRGEEILVTGTRAELEDIIYPTIRREPAMAGQTVQAPPARGPTRGTGRRGGGPGQRNRPWSQTIRPAWRAAVEAGEAKVVPAEALDFEKYLLAQETRGNNNYFTDGGNALRDEVYWQGGYGNPQTLNPARAEAVSLWAAERREKIIAWAKASDSETLRTAADRLAQLLPPPPEADAMNMADATELKMTAAERTLFHRRVLAAWEFLLAVNDRPALARLRELTELERTPLPRPR